MESNEKTPDLFTYTPIGVVHSPHTDISGMPIQPKGAIGIQGTIIIRSELAAGLSDLKDFSHIILIYAFHKSQGYTLKVTPFLDPAPRGVFSTRAPKRPNAIGLSVVRLITIHDNILEIENVDILDVTPLLDIKPYIPAFDAYCNAKAGWLDQSQENAASVKSDERFR